MCLAVYVNKKINFWNAYTDRCWRNLLCTYCVRCIERTLVLWLYLRIAEHIYPCAIPIHSNSFRLISIAMRTVSLCSMLILALICKMLDRVCSLKCTHMEKQKSIYLKLPRSRVKWTSVFSLRESQYAQ